MCVLFRIMLSSRRSGELKNWPKKENNKGIETFLLYIYQNCLNEIMKLIITLSWLAAKSLSTDEMWLRGQVWIIIIGLKRKKVYPFGAQCFPSVPNWGRHWPYDVPEIIFLRDGVIHGPHNTSDSISTLKIAILTHPPPSVTPRIDLGRHPCSVT